MKRTIVRHGSIAAVALTLSLGLAACGGDSEGDTASKDDSTSTASTGSSPSESESTMTDAGADTFGAGCQAIPTDGKGSFDGMVTDPVATAASNNPLLSTLVTAVTKAGLGDTLNNAENITVFAPSNDAFAKIDKKTLNKVLADKAMLTAILTEHVVGQKLSPDMLAGKFETLNPKQGVTVTGSGEDFTVNGNAKVVCGNVQTANATVYIIDTVLLPKS